MKERVVLITGANGQVGRQALVEYASGRKASCIVATDITPKVWIPPEGFNCDFIYTRADLRRRKDLEKIGKIIARRPEKEVLILSIGALFKFSAPRRDLFQVNVEGQKNLVNAVALPLQEKGKEVKFVFWSAAAIYGNFSRKELLPADENYPPDPQDDYSQSKLEAENWLFYYCRNHNLWVTSMRCAAIYGEWSRYGMASAIILQLLGMLEPLIIGTKDNDYGKNYVATIYARDTVRVADFLASRPSANGSVFNVRDAFPRTLEEVVRAQSLACGVKAFRGFRMRFEDFDRFIVRKVMKKVMNFGVEPLVDPELTKMMPLNSALSIKKLEKEFENAGIEYSSYLIYPDVVEGLPQVIKWFKTIGRKEGYLNV